ncbi:MAG: hypothetical protein LBE48_02265, partial [Methanomassiliicoccaceae archaeon]|nr:hypothetical protein [Methanomassiliicoccaceae archaeon]
EFSYWTGDLGGSVNPNEIKMNSDHKIGAVFYDSSDPSKHFTLSLGSADNGNVMWSVKGGIQAILTATGVTFPVDTIADLEAKGNGAWKLSYWTGDLGGNVNPNKLIMNNDRTVGAVFYDSSDPSKYFKLYLVGTTDNGTVIWSVDGGIQTALTAEGVTFPAGTNVDLEAVADEGYKFSHWTDNNAGSRTRTHSGTDLGVNAVFVPITVAEEKKGGMFGIWIWPFLVFTALALLALVLHLIRNRYKVTGMISWNDKGLRGVTINYTMNGKTGVTKTDDDGRYSIGVATEFEIVITNVAKDGYLLTGKTVPTKVITERSSAGVNFVMERGWA